MYKDDTMKTSVVDDNVMRTYMAYGALSINNLAVKSNIE